MELLLDIKEKFPRLDFCEIINHHDEKGVKQFFLDNKKDEDLLPWLNWLLKETRHFNLLRVRLNSGKELVVRKITEDGFLTIINETENVALLMSHIRGIEVSAPLESSAPKIRTLKQSRSEIDAGMRDAVRLQQMILPKESQIEKAFKDFLVIHKQQDIVGGDFYWYRKVGDDHIFALVDCTGHSIEGAMSSMVCNSLMNQALDSHDSNDLGVFIRKFYSLLNDYNQNTSDEFDYGVGAEMAVFCFNFKKQEARMVSSGIAAFLKKGDTVEALRGRKLLDYSNLKRLQPQHTVKLNGVQTSFYTFSDGLTDLFDSQDAKKLGYQRLRQIIEDEEAFDLNYYQQQINKWVGDTEQYDDVTFIGLKVV